MNLLSERLLWAMAEEAKRRDGKPIKKVQIARAAQTSPTSVGFWLTDMNGIAAPQARLLGEYLHVDPLWLETGEGQPTPASVAPSGAAVFDENVRPAPLGTRPIPVISAVQAGALRDMESPYEPGDGYAIEYTDDTGLSRWTFALDIEGQSMMPEFRPGDRVIVDPEVSPNPGDFVVARNGSNQATFKKYRPRGIDHQGNMVFELVPLNDDYPTLRSDTEHLIVLGVLMEHRKKYRRT